MTINPVMGLCNRLGMALKTVEFNRGYIGAMNNPTIGNAYPINGISIPFIEMTVVRFPMLGHPFSEFVIKNGSCGTETCICPNNQERDQ